MDGFTALSSQRAAWFERFRLRHPWIASLRSQRRGGRGVGLVLLAVTRANAWLCFFAKTGDAAPVMLVAYTGENMGLKHTAQMTI